MELSEEIAKVRNRIGANLRSVTVLVLDKWICKAEQLEAELVLVSAPTRKLLDELQAWEAKAALFVDQGEELRQAQETNTFLRESLFEFGAVLERKNEALQQAQEEITAWEAKAVLFVDQGDEIERLRKERDALVQNLKPVIEYVFDGLGETFLPEEHMDRTREDYIVECTIELDSFVSKATRKEIEQERSKS